MDDSFTDYRYIDRHTTPKVARPLCDFWASCYSPTQPDKTTLILPQGEKDGDDDDDNDDDDHDDDERALLKRGVHAKYGNRTKKCVVQENEDSRNTFVIEIGQN